MDPVSAALIILTLILLSGFFAFFDYALYFCRKLRLENQKKLSLCCRLWINIFRMMAAFYTGFNIMRYFALNAEAANTNFIVLIDSRNDIILIAVCAIILGITAALLGDALPKLISRSNPEKFVSALLPVIKVFSIPMLPLIVPSMKFANFVNSAFQLENAETNITEDELRQALLDGEKQGIVDTSERTMVEGVFYLGDRPVGAFMTHRSEIQWLDLNQPYNEIKEKALEHRFQRCFPVVNGSQDEIVGAVYLEDIILDHNLDTPLGLKAIMMKPHFVPETMSALKAFESFKQGQANFLFVMDEYGGLAGTISVNALVEEIVGELSSPLASEEPLKKQEDGSYLADGTLNIDDAAAMFSLTGLPEEDDFHTLAGFILFLAGELPGIGDSFEYQGYRFTVKEMDGNRIDKIQITSSK